MQNEPGEKRRKYNGEKHRVQDTADKRRGSKVIGKYERQHGFRADAEPEQKSDIFDQAAAVDADPRNDVAIRRHAASLVAEQTSPGS